ncbi:hypothetical protein M0805_006957 [Coniferiporia weirii]|nr:hypothetical protein M0805_006957 [Coniferiporia weirii]
MTPSPSPAPAPVAAQQPQQKMRVKREPSERTLFHKKPSRPFALAAMQAANGTAAAANTPSPPSGTRTAIPARPSPAARPKPASSAGSSMTPPAHAVKKSSSPDIKPSLSVASTPPPTQAVTAQTQDSTAKSEPELGYQEFHLVSCDRHGWRYDVMKFDARRPVDIGTWAAPVKLNRKELRREAAGGDGAGTPAPTPVGPMVGPDGKAVIGADGRVVMVDAEGRPIHDKVASASSSQSSAAGGKGAGGKDDKNKKKFQKKTRQVFLVPEHVRQLRREERYPWVMEDSAGTEIWEGRMEEASKSETHGLFMPAPGNVFRFVPAHRWYKFQKRRPQQQLLTLEEAEKIMAKMQKKKDPERWLMRQRNGNAAGGGGGSGGPSLVYDAGGRSLAPGGRRLRTVDAGMRGLFDEDDEEGMEERRRRERERGGEGDLDEMEYEDDFADDEEKVEPDGGDDEEAKELEERLKREYRNANKTREGHIDESDDDEDGDNLTGAGRAMKKLVRKIEKNAAYDSDENENPYASSEEEEEEETPQPTPTGPAVQDQSTPQSKPGVGTPSKPPSQVPSRTGSPAPSLPGGIKIKSEGIPHLPSPQSPVLGMGGHSVVAKRATSPKAPKLKGQGQGSRATSPLASGVGSRAASPNPSPVSPGVGNAASPGSALSKKRKAEDGVATPPASGGSTPGAQPKLKKRKPTNAGASGAPSTPGGPGPAANAGAAAGAGATVEPGTELTAALLVQWLKASVGATTRECIHYFQPCLTDDAKKARFTALVKEVASLKTGALVLKPQYRDEEVKA